MLFKDVKTSYPVYILHKTDEPFVSQGKVVSMPTTHINQMPSYNPMTPQTSQLMVDVTIEDSGVTKTYTIPENSSLTYGNELVLATERELLVRELENLKAMSEEHIKQAPRHEKLIGCYDKLLSELNPAFKEKQATEARFGKIENDVTDIKTMMQDLFKKFS